MYSSLKMTGLQETVSDDHALYVSSCFTERIKLFIYHPAYNNQMKTYLSFNIMHLTRWFIEKRKKKIKKQGNRNTKSSLCSVLFKPSKSNVSNYIENSQLICTAYWMVSLWLATMTFKELIAVLNSLVITLEKYLWGCLLLCKVKRSRPLRILNVLEGCTFLLV